MWLIYDIIIGANRQHRHSLYRIRHNIGQFVAHYVLFPVYSQVFSVYRRNDAVNRGCSLTSDSALGAKPSCRQ